MYPTCLSNLFSFYFKSLSWSYHYRPLWKVHFSLSCGLLELLKGHSENFLKAFSSTGWTTPALSLSSCGLHRRALVFFMAFLWTHSNRPTSFSCWWPQSWMQQSRCGLMRAGRGRIPSLALLSTLLWMQPRTPLVFWSVKMLCQAGEVSIVILLMAALKLFSAQPVFVSGALWPRCRALHLALLTWIFHEPTS